MFITRKRFEQELRRAEAKGRREQRREMEAEYRINAINTDMWNYCGNIAKECDMIQNKLERIERCLGMCSDEKTN
jgi:hypothetical protein